MMKPSVGGSDTSKEATCSWCKKEASDLDMLLVMSGEETAICSDCVDICSEIVNDEREMRARRDKH